MPHDDHLWLAEEIEPRKRKAKPRERSFLTQLGHSFREAGAFFYKIQDLPHFAGSQFRFDAEKPFDAFAAYQGFAMAIEGKSLRDYEAFGVSQLRQCQVDGLNLFQDNGASFVMINVKVKKTTIDGTAKMNRLLILDWREHGERLVKHSSIKKAELAAMPYIECVGERFDLRPWLMSLTR